MKDAGYFKRLKERDERFAVLTCYDFPTAQCEEEAGIDILLVGDSVGTNVLGYASEREVTIEDMVHHTAAVCRGRTDAYVIADMPYGTCESVRDGLVHANRLGEAGANCIKIEGVKPELVAAVHDAGIDVCGHLGLLPQVHEKMSMQAGTSEAAAQLVQDSLALEAAGAAFVLFEVIPREVAAEATRRLKVPTIGIGAGAGTDGQVLVVVDLLGISLKDFRHNRRYADTRSTVIEAMKSYADDVRAGAFPADDHGRSWGDAEQDAFLAALEEQAS